MESIAILGIAGNAVQFIDFSTKLVSKTQSLYHSGRLIEHHDLDLVNQDVVAYINRLQADLKINHLILSENDLALGDICQKCLTIAKEINSALAQMQLKGSYGRWNSFRHALKAIWGSDKLAETKARLELYQQQLQLRMHTKTQESISGLRDDMMHTLKSTSIAASQEHQTTREDVNQLRKEAEERAQQLKAELQLLKIDLENAIKEVVGSSVQANQTAQKKMQQSTNVKYALWAAKEAMLKQVLETLSTYSMPFREDLVPRDGSPEEIRNCMVHIDTVDKRTRGVETSSHTRSSSKQFELWYPIAAGNVSMLKLCLENGADVNAMYKPDMDWERTSPLLEMPPLIAALLPGHDHRQAIVELLLEYGADPTATDNGGTSVFKYALKTEDRDLIKTVVTALYERDMISEYPRKLLSADRKIAKKSSQHLRWDLALAIMNPELLNISEILLQKASLSPEFTRTGTLHLAVIYGNESAVSTLLFLGEPAFMRNSLFSSPFGIALRKQLTGIIRAMLSRIDSEDNSEDVRDQYWYRQIFLNAPQSYPNTDIIEMILDYIPLIEAMHHAVNDENEAWIHRIAMKVAPNLLTSLRLQYPDANVAKIQKPEFWRLMEKAFDGNLSRKWILEIDVERSTHYIDGLHVTFAEKICGWIDEMRMKRRIDNSVANLDYIMKAHIAREKWKK